MPATPSAPVDPRFVLPSFTSIGDLDQVPPFRPVWGLTPALGSVLPEATGTAMSCLFLLQRWLPHPVWEPLAATATLVPIPEPPEAQAWLSHEG